MKALVYLGPGNKRIEDRPKPELKAPSDAIVKMTKTTICGRIAHLKAMSLHVHRDAFLVRRELV